MRSLYRISVPEKPGTARSRRIWRLLLFRRWLSRQCYRPLAPPFSSSLDPSTTVLSCSSHCRHHVLAYDWPLYGFTRESLLLWSSSRSDASLRLGAWASHQGRDLEKDSPVCVSVFSFLNVSLRSRFASLHHPSLTD